MTQNEKTKAHEIVVKLIIGAKHKFIQTQEYKLAANMRTVEHYMTTENEKEKEELSKWLIELESLNVI